MNRSPARVVHVAFAAMGLALINGPTGASPARSPKVVASTSPSAASVATPATDPPPQALDWRACSPAAQGVECAELGVPLDHDHPSGASITITMARRRAASAKLRIGVLFVNPGGPGGSAIDLVRDLPLPAAVTQRFDIVGVEPRGLPRASPVRCDGTALRGTSINAATAAAYAKSCARVSGPILPFIDSDSVARDVEAARVALGEPKASILTYSYGSLLGLAYLRRFPARLRALVMDAPVDPTQTSLATHITALDAALAAFLHDCTQAAGLGSQPTTPVCILARGGPPAARLAKAEARFARGPIAAAGRGRPPIDRATFETVLAILLADGNFKSLAQVIDDTAGGASLWLTSTIGYLGVDASAFRPYGDAGIGAYEAYLCRDGMAPSDSNPPRSSHFTHYAARRLQARRCAAWPVGPKPTPPLSLTTVPILVVATTFDVRSPLAGAESIATRLGAPLLSFAAAGHGIVGQGNACIDDRVTALLVSLSPPPLMRSVC